MDKDWMIKFLYYEWSEHAQIMVTPQYLTLWCTLRCVWMLAPCCRRRLTTFNDPLLHAIMRGVTPSPCMYHRHTIMLPLGHPIACVHTFNGRSTTAPSCSSSSHIWKCPASAAIVSGVQPKSSPSCKQNLYTVPQIHTTLWHTHLSTDVNICSSLDQQLDSADVAIITSKTQGCPTFLCGDTCRYKHIKLWGLHGIGTSVSLILAPASSSNSTIGKFSSFWLMTCIRGLKRTYMYQHSDAIMLSHNTNSDLAMSCERSIMLQQELHNFKMAFVTSYQNSCPSILVCVREIM